MKKSLLPILLFLIGCVSSTKQKEVVIHDIDTDFPKADTVSVLHKQDFEILQDVSQILVRDTTLFALGWNNEVVGYCYNITNGSPITPIVNRGKASNEIATHLYSLKIVSHRDTIQFIDLVLQEIKSIGLNDILSKPVGERAFSKTTISNPINSYTYKKIDNNLVIGQSYKNDQGLKYFISDNNQLSYFGKYNEKIFESEVNQELTPEMLGALYESTFTNRGSKIVSADKMGVILELIDVNSKTIVNDRFYNKITIGKQDFGGSISPPDLNTIQLYSTDKYVYCIVAQKDKKMPKTSENKSVDISILVFDWDLNPVKKYYIGSSPSTGYRVCLTEDCTKFYYLSLKGEKQMLFEGELN